MSGPTAKDVGLTRTCPNVGVLLVEDCSKREGSSEVCSRLLIAPLASVDMHRDVREAVGQAGGAESRKYLQPCLLYTSPSPRD